jgi:hypothetical protein
VTSLAAAPPTPLILGESDDVAPPMPELVVKLSRPRTQLRRVEAPRVRRMWVGVAAAAVVIAIAGGIWRMSTSGPRFPQSPTLRGSAGGPLLYPRDRVLIPSSEARAAFPALGAPIVFELEAQAEATQYRINLARHEGGAFGRDVPLLSWDVPTTTTTMKEPLAAGRYTWSAWAVVRGLDRPLEPRDFEVREDAKISSELVKLADRAEPARTIAAIGILHDAGYSSDARALARTLPASVERDRYLETLPGR